VHLQKCCVLLDAIAYSWTAQGPKFHAWSRACFPDSWIFTTCSQGLKSVLEMTPYAFSLELAALAASRGLLDLEQWAVDLMTQDAINFVAALLAFMDARTSVSM
jgi:hypothetical protein